MFIYMDYYTKISNATEIITSPLLQSIAKQLFQYLTQIVP